MKQLQAHVHVYVNSGDTDLVLQLFSSFRSSQSMKEASYVNDVVSHNALLWGAGSKAYG